jgi:predicted O-methyltransferase YrrM
MVKNAGPQFREMLQENLQFIDKWTILDTGSTDETIQIIKEVLVDKKEGTLYEEPFINFRDSRNRLLDLAGSSCKYNLMLDDTYIIKGDLRSFLNEVRSDQYSTSFTLFINSDDCTYGSNRITKSNSGLRYMFKIHEVITDKNNINIIIPKHLVYIDDRRFDYMEKRTMKRKELDLKLLFEEMEDDPHNPRTYYYLAQTYYLLEEYDKSFYYFMKRCEYKNAGFFQERVDAAFEAARIANFKLNKPWQECEKMYLEAFKIDESRHESLYFIGIHYYLENNFIKAYDYFKRGFEIEFPQHCQYSLKPTLSFHFLPKFLTRVCYYVEDFLLGEKVSEFFLLNNKNDSEDYDEILSWHLIYKKLNIYNGPRIPVNEENEIFCFVADGGFNPWSGSNILTTGVGGSETYIIEIARYIKKHSKFDVYVFCNTPEEKDEIFEGVYYKHLNSYYKFINTRYVKHCIISRYSEYLPVTFKGFTENVYFVIHDLTSSGNVIPMNNKLKNIFCLTEWHVKYFTNRFPILKNITVPFYYGIDNKFKHENIVFKQKNKFIYSSFPNRGLLQLLQMWPKIYQKYNNATLHIYSDIDHKWSNDVEPEKMLLIKNLLSEYNYKENGLGIHYHGWVDKNTLANAWTTADIWFYPCTFMETFCLTSLEAASSKTLCVTNDLAALQNTVENRGIIISGDPTTKEWQSVALEKLFFIMDDANYKEKINLINNNYNWAKTLSWENQAVKLLDEYIYPNNVYEYKGMYNWTNNIPFGSKDIFINIISYFNTNYNKIKFGKKIFILELGSYTGMSLIQLVKLIPNSYGTGIDMWSNYNENSLLNVIDNYNVKQSFYKNIKNAGLQDKIHGIQIDTTSALIQFIKDNKKFDFIYVDGSHLLLDCYSDLILSWEILENGGILAIDDYTYNSDNSDKILNSPFQAVNHFLKIFNGKYKLLNISYRVFLEKI